MNWRAAVLASVLTFTASSRVVALPESTRGPFYVQVTPLGYNHWASAPGFCGGSGCGGWPGFRPDIEFGIHPSGRHDGIVFALRQSFIFTAGPDNVGGATALRLGYDIAIPIKSFELVLAPYAAAGIGYAFGGGGTLGFNAGFFGAEAKFFVKKGLYAFLRPFEFGMQCFHTSGTSCWLQYVFGVGVGFAFPSMVTRVTMPD